MYLFFTYSNLIYCEEHSAMFLSVNGVGSSHSITLLAKPAKAFGVPGGKFLVQDIQRLACSYSHNLCSGTSNVSQAQSFDTIVIANAIIQIVISSVTVI